jgi:hypothetical protein
MYEPLYSKRYEIVNGVVEVDGVTKEAADETPAEQKGSHILPLLTCLSIPSWLNAYYSFRPNI